LNLDAGQAGMMDSNSFLAHAPLFLTFCMEKRLAMQKKVK